MTVEPLEVGRFHVKSALGKTFHLVDVNYKGRFRCSCQHHSFRLEPLLEREGRIPRPCKHARAVVKFLGMAVIDRLRETNPEEKDPT